MNPKPIKSIPHVIYDSIYLIVPKGMNGILNYVFHIGLRNFHPHLQKFGNR
jgi:hypothetical protein